MNFFKKTPPAAGAPDAREPVAPAPSVQALRRRARHRLLGATLLVVLVVALFPLLLETTPRSANEQVRIVLGGQGAAPEENGAAAALATPMVTEPVTRPAAPPAQSAPPVQSVAPAPPPAAASDALTPAPLAAASTAAPPPPPAATREAKPAAAPASKPRTRDQRDQDALQALLADRGAAPAQADKPAKKPAAPAPDKAPAAADKGRFVVQAGAYSDAQKVAQVRRKLSAAGLKNYVQTIKSGDKEVTRVRVGPFASRPDMERAAEKVRALGLPAVVVNLP